MATLGLAIALMLILEGLLPFAAPARWREILRRVAQLSDGQIRFFGLASIVTGVVLLLVVA
jgi:uncharacterized protein YjeT (DUF2065 family)